VPSAAWMTIAVAGLIVVFTAAGLIRVVLHLRAIRATLAAVAGGVRAVDQLTSTVPARLASVNANLKPVAEFLEAV
jgi:hypothetical protein